MKELVYRLTSRKFLLTVATGLTLAANRQWNELVILVLGYMGVNVAATTVKKK